MPRKAKGIHTCPENAGAKNMTPENLEKVKAKPSGDESEFMSKTLPIFNRSLEKNRRDYAGKWTEDELRQELSDFFTYTMENDLEPSPPMLRLWLCVGKTQIYEWRKGNHGFKTELINDAYDVMEMRYFNKLDKYAVSNIFKLKTVHGYVETTKVEVNNTNTTDADAIKEQIAKMGLNN